MSLSLQVKVLNNKLVQLMENYGYTFVTAEPRSMTATEVMNLGVVLSELGIDVGDTTYVYEADGVLHIDSGPASATR